MYTPSFQPKKYAPRNMDLNKFRKNNYMAARENQYDEEDEEEEEEDDDDDDRKNKRKKRKRKNKDSDEEDEDESNEEDEEEEEEEEKEKKEEDDFDFQQDTMKFAEDDVQDALRNTLFHKKKKKGKK